MGARSITGVVFLLAALASSHAAAMPPGYFVDSSLVSAERPPNATATDGDFTFTIDRRYDGPLAEHLLSIAEATYPPREILLDRAIARRSEIGSDSAKTPLWWCDGLGVS